MDRIGRKDQFFLRGYQREQISAVQAALKVARSTLVVAATGTGKTVLIAELARLIATQGWPLAGFVLVVLNRDELVAQTANKLRQVGIEPGVEQGARRAALSDKVIVASVQSLRGARLTRFAAGGCALVIVDECHHAVAASYRAVIDYFSSAKVLGVTATPDRADQKSLRAVFDSVAHEFDIKTAIRDGFLVPILARRVIVKAVDLSKVAMRGGDFAPDQLAAAMRKAGAIDQQVQPLLELAGQRQTVAYGVDVAHAEAIAAALNALRPGCARAVSGKTDSAARSALLSAFERGEFQFLCNCELLVEGWDSPEVACVAVMRPTRSRGRLVQMVGRGLRPAPWAAKRDCLVIVFADRDTPGLMGPADALAGIDEIDSNLRREIEELIGSANMDLAKAIEQGKANAQTSLEMVRGQAIVDWHAKVMDPFVGGAQTAIKATAFVPPTADQLRALDKLLGGAIADRTVKLPTGFAQAHAVELTIRLQQRHLDGLCSYKQARMLSRAGVVDPSRITAKRATELFALARSSAGIDWSILSRRIANQPEAKQC